MNFEFETLSLKFNDSELYIIDQQLLPRKEEWVKITSPADIIDAIQKLKVRGAPLIGVAAALCLGQFYKSQPDQRGWDVWAEKVRSSRPTAVNLMWAVDRMKRVVLSGADKLQVWSEAKAIFQEDVELCQKIAKHGAKRIQSGDQILTHCNTGGLATAGVGTALGVIAEAYRQEKNIHVYVDETRPLLQGGRLTAYELEKLEIPYTLICDNMAGMLMAQSRIDRVIVGSDRIARNGDFANKIGTYSLSVLSAHHDVDFYVAAPLTTVDLECAKGEAIPIEERKSEEVKGYAEWQWAPEKARVYNPAFDVTPARFVSGWILDSGFYSQEDIKSGRFEREIKTYFRGQVEKGV